MNFDASNYPCNFFKKMFFTFLPINIVEIQYNIDFHSSIEPGDQLCLSKDWTQMVEFGYVAMPVSRKKVLPV